MTQIPAITNNPAIDLALDTIKKNKQALIFVNSKRSAEKTAEDISKALKGVNIPNLSETALRALPRPTKQCERLSRCLRKGVAFHHAGLHAKQKELIEDEFRNGKITIIAATPTLCLSPDTMVWHGMEETEVSKLKKSHQLFVLSQDRLMVMKSPKVQKNENSSDLIRITSVSGYSITTTPNHQLFIKRNKKKILVPANQTKAGDRIATIGRIDLNKASHPMIKSFILDNSCPVDNLKFNPLLSYFVGIMLGDGYSGAETNDKSIIYKGSPTLVGTDPEVFSVAKMVCNLIQLPYRESKTYNSTPQLVLGKHKWFREFLVRCGIEKRDRKHISPSLMKMNMENTASLLRGLFDTDGCVEKRGGISFSNISLTLVKQIQKLLLRFGIISSIRKRQKGPMKIYGKEYQTVEIYELSIFHKRGILDFYRTIGFNIVRKQNSLIDIVSKIISNYCHISCYICNYNIYLDVFSGRTKEQKIWGKRKKKIIQALGQKGPLPSNELKELLGFEHKKNDSKLNHHYEFIKRKRISVNSKTEWLWQLNTIGKWIFNNILSQGKTIHEFLKMKNCPLCKTELRIVIKKGWRDDDFEGDIYWDIIKNVEKSKNEKTVYDVVLPNKPDNDHLFVAEGFIVHNSYGLDLPAFRSIIKDLKRFTQRGMQYIPVLEYLQMAGRAGRPGKEAFGESIIICANEKEEKKAFEHFIEGDPEPILSKLAVEPVLRTYILSLIVSGTINTKKELLAFFEKTFWAHQSDDFNHLHTIIDKMLNLLTDFNFIISSKNDDFITANNLNNEKFTTTTIGKRVSQLYLDPITANFMIDCLNKNIETNAFSYLQAISFTLELRPLLRVRNKDFDAVNESLIKLSEFLLKEEPDPYDINYDDFLDSVKTALFLNDWIEEKDEEFMLEKYDIRPGEIHAKLTIADWLLYSFQELAKLIPQKKAIKDITKLRMRLKYGVKEELIPLLKLKNIGRMRARKLFNNRVKDMADIKKIDFLSLSQLVGKAVAVDIKNQVGENHKKPEKKKRTLLDY